MHSRTPCRGNFFASCIPEGAPDGKRASPWQRIAAVHPKRAGFGKICAPCMRKALQIAFRECIARRSCQGGALFAALTPRITHGARILPSHRRRRTARAPQLSVCAIRASHSAEAWPRSRRHPPPQQRPEPPERGASLAPVAIKVAVAFRLPYARRLTAPVFCAFGSCDRHINARQSPPSTHLFRYGCVRIAFHLVKRKHYLYNGSGVPGATCPIGL